MSGKRLHTILTLLWYVLSFKTSGACSREREREREREIIKKDNGKKEVEEESGICCLPRIALSLPVMCIHCSDHIVWHNRNLSAYRLPTKSGTRNEGGEKGERRGGGGVRKVGS